MTELASVIWAVQMSTVEFHPWNSRRADTERPDEWRIDLDPMPDVRLRHGAPGRARRPRGARRARRGRLAEDLGRQRACTSTSGSSRGGASPTYAGPRWPSPARSSAARRDDVTTTWWRKDRDPRAALRRLQPERPRPHDRQRLLGARRAGGDRVHADHAGTRSTTSSPRDFTIATVPARFAELGDLHAGHRRRGLLPRHPAGMGRARRARGVPDPGGPADVTADRPG